MNGPVITVHSTVKRMTAQSEGSTILSERDCQIARDRICRRHIYLSVRLFVRLKPLQVSVLLNFEIRGETD